MSRLVSGFGAMARGFRLVKSRGDLLAWSLIPFLLDVCLLVGLWIWGFPYVGEWSNRAVLWLLPDNEGWRSIVFGIPLYFLFALGFLIFTVLMVFILASLVASPFHSIVARRVLESRGLIDHSGRGWLQELFASLRMLGASLFKTLIFLTIAIPLFVLSFVPVVNLFSAWIGMMMMVYDSADFSYEALELPLRQRWSRFRAMLPEFIGASLCLALTLLLPGLTLLVAPLVVIGLADLVGEKGIKSGLQR